MDKYCLRAEGGSQTCSGLSFGKRKNVPRCRARIQREDSISRKSKLKQRLTTNKASELVKRNQFAFTTSKRKRRKIENVDNQKLRASW